MTTFDQNPNIVATILKFFSSNYVYEALVGKRWFKIQDLIFVSDEPKICKVNIYEKLAQIVTSFNHQVLHNRN
jgi:hypothetical protein